MKKTWLKTASEIELALVALLFLSLLFPIALLHSVNSIPFFTIFFLHLAILVFATVHSIKSIISLYKDSSLTSVLFLTFSILIATAAIIPSMLLPVTARDALIHHLAIPKLWIAHGAIYPTPWHEWSFYPMLIQLAFTALLQLGPEQLCALYILLFLPLVIVTTSQLALIISAKKEASIFACCLIIITPVIIKLSGIPIVDLPLVFLCGAAIYFHLKLQQDLSKTSNAYMAGIAWGLALSCKLNALPAFGLSMLIFIATSFSQPSKKNLVVRQYFIIALLAIACFSPWLIRNTLWTSNPLYPYLSSVFGQHIPKFDSGLVGLNPIQQRLLLYGESIPELILLPFRIFLEGEDNNPKLFDGKLSALLLIGIIFGLFCLKEKKYRQVTFYSIAFILFALFSTAARARYLAPTLIVLAALGGSALATLASRSKFGSVCTNVAMLLQIVASFLYLQKSYPFSEALAYAQGTLSRAQYLDSQIPEYPLIEYCNSALSQDSRISLVYTGNQFYLYERQTFSAGHTSADQLIGWIRHSTSAIEMLSNVTGSGLTHFVINDARLISVLETVLSPEKQEVWNEFRQNHLLPLFSARGFTLYQVQ